MSALTNFLSLFFPSLCLLCKTPLIGGEEYICLHCLNKLPYIHTGMENPMNKLFDGQERILSAQAFLYFEKGGYAQKLIHALKYHEKKELGKTLGRMAARKIEVLPDYAAPDLLIPSPLYPQRQRKRGYNQSEWIARGFNEAWGTPIDTTHLIRVQDTKTQTRKTIYERKQSMEHSFQLRNGSELCGKHILLIDDVITSGATMEGCISKLLEEESVTVSIFGLSAVR